MPLTHTHNIPAGVCDRCTVDEAHIIYNDISRYFEQASIMEWSDNDTDEMFRRILRFIETYHADSIRPQTH